MMGCSRNSGHIKKIEKHKKKRFPGFSRNFYEKKSGNPKIVAGNSLRSPTLRKIGLNLEDNQKLST